MCHLIVYAIDGRLIGAHELKWKRRRFDSVLLSFIHFDVYSFSNYILKVFKISNFKYASNICFWIFINIYIFKGIKFLTIILNFVQSWCMYLYIYNEKRKRKKRKINLYETKIHQKQILQYRFWILYNPLRFPHLWTFDVYGQFKRNQASLLEILHINPF